MVKQYDSIKPWTTWEWQIIIQLIVICPELYISYEFRILEFWKLLNYVKMIRQKTIPERLIPKP